jgi:hypothetical protein
LLGRQLQVLVGVLNGVLAMTWLGAFYGFHSFVTVAYAPAVALIALPLAMRSWRPFRVTCLVVAALLLVAGVLLYFFAMFSLWPSAAMLLLALSPLARWRPRRMALLLALVVAIPWCDAIWVSHLR